MGDERILDVNPCAIGRAKCTPCAVGSFDRDKEIIDALELAFEFLSRWQRDDRGGRSRTRRHWSAAATDGATRHQPRLLQRAWIGYTCRQSLQVVGRRMTRGALGLEDGFAGSRIADDDRR